MRWSKRGTTALAAAMLWAGAALAQSLPQPLLEKAYDAVTPAICLVTYTAELTNPQTGASDRRDIRVLGLLTSKDGLVMCHGHMQVENAAPMNIRVTVGQGDAEKEYPAKLLKKPDDVNVCFVRIETDQPVNFPYVKFARNVLLSLGQPVAVVGVMSETLDYQRALNVRMVGATLEKPRTTYCLDQPVAIGYIGGPVVNEAGQVVGVIGVDLSAEEGGELYTRSGVALIYQADLFAKYIDAPPTETEAGKAREEAWLGVFTQPLTDDLAEYWGLPKEGGIVASAIVPGSPGEKVGMREGDVIVSFNGTPIHSKLNREMLSFTKLVRDAEVGSVVPVHALRDGKPIDFTVTLAERPKAARDAEEFEDKTFGLTVRELTTDVRILFNLSEDVQGVVVRRVKSGSFADLAQIRPGVIIMTFGGQPVANLEDFKTAVKKVAEGKPSEIPVFSRIGARTGFFRLQPRWDMIPESEKPNAPSR